MINCQLVSPNGHALKKMDEWLTPAFPDWFKDLPSTRYKFDHERQSFNTNAKGCPSFVRLFKNSYLLRAPEDIMITPPTSRPGGGKVMFASEVSNAPPFLSVHSSNLGTEMHPSFAKTHVNLQFGFKFVFVPEAPIEMVYLDPCYHLDKKSDLTAMTGTLQLHPEMYMCINVNMLLPFAAFDDKNETFIKKGQPLAYLFFPGGRPKIEPKKITMREWDEDYGYRRETFQGHWISEMGKLEAEERQTA